MKELAEALKAKAGLRMRQGVVSAVDGSTVSVLIGGSTVAVEGVHHLNSVAPQVGEVVWIASDGADLWILGTHGDPPAIDPSRLPDYATYFASAAPEGTPATPTNVLGTALLNGLLVRWDRTAYDPWLTWEIQLSDDDWVSWDTFTTATQPVVVPLPPGGPFYLRVRAINSVTSDVSGWGYDFSQAHANPTVEVDWDDMPAITETQITDLAVSTPKLAANAVTAAKINAADVQAAVVTAEAVNALEINASAIKAGTIDAARLDVASILASEITAANITGGSIEGVSITGQTITGGTFRTKSTGNRIVLSGGASDRISFYAGSFDTPAEVSISTWEIGGGKGGYALDLAGPSVTADEDPYGVSIAQAYKTVADAIVPDYTDVTITATNLAVDALAHFYDRVDCDSSVRCAGRFLPTTDYNKTTDLTGVFIQDSYTKGNRWRVVFNSSTKQMALINGSTIYRATFA